MMRDISHRRRLEMLLRETEDKLVTVLKSVGEGIVLVDEHGKFLHYNKKAEEITGLGPLDIPPSEWPARYRIFRPDGKLFDAKDLPLVRAMQGETVDQAEVIIRPENTPERHLLVSARPVHNASGHVTAAVADFRDVTEVRKMEALVREIQEKYEELLNTRTGNGRKAEGGITPKG
jgi:PAS domain S-box-containing protein